MAVIIGNPSPSKPNQSRYVDLALDFDISRNIGQVKQNDIKTITDQAVMANRMSNLLATLPGQLVLHPEFGCNLNQYLFGTVSRDRGYVIGQYIQRQISEYVPEISLKAINISADVDRQVYDIEVIYTNPLLSDKPLTLNGQLNKSEGSVIFTNE